MDHTKELTCLALHPGLFGLERGIQESGTNIRICAAVESEAFAAANMACEMERNAMDSAPMWTNPSTFVPANFYGMVDIITSNIPYYRREDPTSSEPTQESTAIFTIRCIKDIRPSIAFIAGPKGISTDKPFGFDDGAGSRASSILQLLITRLERMGYTPTAGMFSPIEAGHPYESRHWFIYAALAGVEAPRNPMEPRTSEVVYPKLARVAGKHENQHHWEHPRTLSESHLDRNTSGTETRIHPTEHRVDRIHCLSSAINPQLASLAWSKLS